MLTGSGSLPFQPELLNQVPFPSNTTSFCQKTTAEGAFIPPKQTFSIGRRLCYLAMNHKFGGGKLPTGTPSLAWSSVVVVVSLLAGASVVHNLYKPDLTLPPVDGVVGTKENQQPEKTE